MFTIHTTFLFTKKKCAVFIKKYNILKILQAGPKISTQKSWWKIKCRLYQRQFLKQFRLTNNLTCLLKVTFVTKVKASFGISAKDCCNQLVLTCTKYLEETKSLLLLNNKWYQVVNQGQAVDRTFHLVGVPCFGRRGFRRFVPKKSKLMWKYYFQMVHQKRCPAFLIKRFEQFLSNCSL
jgi:hypothetical protein